MYTITCKPLQTRRPPCTGLPAWGSTADPLVLSQGYPCLNYNLATFKNRPNCMLIFRTDLCHKDPLDVDVSLKILIIISCQIFDGQLTR